MDAKMVGTLGGDSVGLRADETGIAAGRMAGAPLMSLHEVVGISIPPPRKVFGVGRSIA